MQHHFQNPSVALGLYQCIEVCLVVEDKAEVERAYFSMGKHQLSCLGHFMVQTHLLVYMDNVFSSKKHSLCSFWHRKAIISLTSCLLVMWPSVIYVSYSPHNSDAAHRDQRFNSKQGLE